MKVWRRESEQKHRDVDVSAPCSPGCPAKWLNYEGKCYFFSEEEKDWPSSQSFCASHGSSLAVIETETEKVRTTSRDRELLGEIENQFLQNQEEFYRH